MGVFARTSRASVAGVFGVVGAVSLVTAGASVGVVSVRSLAATPRATAEGKVWLLFSSALVADRPIAAELLAFAGFAIVVLLLVGPRILWSSAILGHVGSTLTVYGLVGGVRLIVPAAFASVLSFEDYGMSAIIAAWVGVVAAVAWRWRRGAAARFGVAAFCATAVLIAWALRPEITVLDSEHLVAFAIGVAATQQAPRRYANRVLKEWSRAVGAAAGSAVALRRQVAERQAPRGLM